jgi:hypothetical protein
VHGNPYYRLFKHEVKSLVVREYGEKYLNNKALENELADVNRKLRKLNKEISSLKIRKAQLMDIV